MALKYRWRDVAWRRRAACRRQLPHAHAAAGTAQRFAPLAVCGRKQTTRRKGICAAAATSSTSAALLVGGGDERKKRGEKYGAGIGNLNKHRLAHAGALSSRNQHWRRARHRCAAAPLRHSTSANLTGGAPARKRRRVNAKRAATRANSRHNAPLHRAARRRAYRVISASRGEERGAINIKKSCQHMAVLAGVSPSTMAAHMCHRCTALAPIIACSAQFQRGCVYRQRA